MAACRDSISMVRPYLTGTLPSCRITITSRCTELCNGRMKMDSKIG